MKKATTRVLAVLFTAAALTAGLGNTETIANEPIVGLGGGGSGGGGYRLGGLPKFGVRSHHVPGFGMFVTGVVRGSEAEQQTLEPYDMIVAFNGVPLDNAGDFENEIRNAIRYDRWGNPYGSVTLTVRNCNNGRLVPVRTNLRDW